MARPLSKALRNLRLSTSTTTAGPSQTFRAASTNTSSSLHNPNNQSTGESSSLSQIAAIPSVLPYHPVPRKQDFPNPWNNPLHKHINYPERLYDIPPSDARPETLGGNSAARKEAILKGRTGLSSSELRGLVRFNVRVGRVVQMTKKGKIPSFTALVVVGSPTRGLVGIGWGRGQTGIQAMDAGYHKAVTSMDFVNRYEGRTLWGQGKDLISKWGACKIIMRARPAGFGLMVPPSIHRLFTACGIKDASVTIEGSRNPVEVIKGAIQILHGGANPPGLGSGVGTRARREDKGMGMRSRAEIERERGRYGIDIGRRV